ncbi:hypothetical protein [Caldimonas caldifontis]|uniref:hypothetical protein n=1 Tax=Caldimonas caldifontis TaxID=1452508 RepID=UPI0011B0B489|nr:hypothetical protein [Caldimonas caldifontis]
MGISATILIIFGLCVGAAAIAQESGIGGGREERLIREELRQRRIDSAQAEWRAASERRRAVRVNEYFLITFVPNDRPNNARLLTLLRSHRLATSAVYFQGETLDGVYGFSIDSRRELAGELSRVSEELPAAREIRRRQSAQLGGQDNKGTNSVKEAEGDSNYCAIEVRGLVSDVEAFRRAHSEKIISIEIIGDRMRMLPSCER